MVGATACADDGAPERIDADSGTTAVDTDTGGVLDPPPAGPESAPDPSELGPYPVGVRTFELVDDSRMDEMGRPRPISVEVWYPAVEEARDMEPFTYAIEDVLRPEVLEDISGIQIALETNAVRDADVRADESFPVVLFSHGSSGVRMQSTYLTAPLASHGYVVVSPDHYGNTLSDAILAGGVDPSTYPQALADRPFDMAFVLNWLETLPADDPLAAASDTERLGVAGHSFGALTAIRWMGMGAPADAIVAQAPPGFDLAWLAIQDDLSTFDTPIMLHVGALDTTTPPSDAESIWAEASPPRSRLTLATGGHFTFSDMCTIPREALQAIAAAGVFDALDDGCSDANLDATQAFGVLRHYAIGYFNLHLRGSVPTADLLTQDAGRGFLGEEVTFELDP